MPTLVGEGRIFTNGETTTATPEQIVRKLREADRMLGEGAAIEDVARHLEVMRRPTTGGATSTAA